LRFISFQNQIHSKKRSELVKIICPECSISEELQIPKKIINQSKQLTTVSIPSNLICEHSFQVFIDKNFHIRGYQKVDFDFSALEFYEDNPTDMESYEAPQSDYIINYKLSKIIKFSIKALRKITKNSEILGTALFFEKGKVIYSSLPEKAFLRAVDETEYRHDLNLNNFKTSFIILNNYQKLISSILEIEGHKLMIYLLVTYDLDFISCDSLMRRIINKILRLYLQLLHFKGRKGEYWVYSNICPDKVLNDSEKIKLESLNIETSKSKILNLEEIKKISEFYEFEGKVYISKEYVELMRGLSVTLKSARTFIDMLNRTSK
jgi:hypothetical protein